MSRPMIVTVVAVLVVAVGVLGWQLHEERKQPNGVEISIGSNGLSVKEK